MRNSIPASGSSVSRAIPLMLACAAALGGCSGGGGGSAPNAGANAPPPPVPAPAPPPGGSPTCRVSAFNSCTAGGIWWGGVSRAGQPLSAAVCLLIESGELSCVLYDNAGTPPAYLGDPIGAMRGTALVSNSGPASGSGRIYASPGRTLDGGSTTVADFSITGGGLLNDNSVLTLGYTSLGEQHEFRGWWDHYYAVFKPAFRWPVHGAYTTFDVYGDAAALSIAADGRLFMQSASGCTGDGQVRDVDPPVFANVTAYNAYAVELSVGDCRDLDGSYRGLATLVDFAWVNGYDNLVIAVFSDTKAIVGEAIK